MSNGLNGTRGYQQRAIDGVRAYWAAGVVSVLLVAPTGAGKSRMGEELAADAVGRGDVVLWVAHRRDLVEQAAAQLIARFGMRNVGVIMPGGTANASARIQVGSIQTLLRREPVPGVKLVIPDEAHHYAAADWRSLADMYRRVPTVGLTATPWRSDAAPLGGMFQEIVVAAHYSELLRDGYLVPVCMYRPGRSLGHDLAEDPFAAWLRLSGGAQTIVFCARVDIARRLARRFREGGISAAMVEGDMSRLDRVDALARFRRGAIRVLTNVNVFTEGIDVPDCGCVVLAKAYEHPTGFIQATGRALRTSSNKSAAIIIDLTGCSNRVALGLPTDDRVYALDAAATGAAGEGTAPPEGGELYNFTQDVLGEPLHHVGIDLQTEPILAAPVTKPARQSRETMNVRPIEGA